MFDLITRMARLTCHCLSVLLVGLVLTIWLAQGNHAAFAQDGTNSDYDPTGGIVGPFIGRADVVTQLDCPETETGTRCAGILNFNNLVQKQFPTAKTTERGDFNPFKLKEAAQIVKTIRADLTELGITANAADWQIDPEILTDRNSRIELVGVINRMDRQFLSTQRESICGEISAIYRFSYSIDNGRAKSRLPITMNIVFPATNGTIDCKTIAQRWLTFLQSDLSRPPAVIAADLVDPKSGALAGLIESNISRLELNFQVYRKPAGIAEDFGSEAGYIIRVYRWNSTAEVFEPAELPNQIEPGTLLCKPSDSTSLCTLKRQNRAKLVQYLQHRDTVEDIDRGTLDIPDSLGILSKRAISISPGGSHRSVNQPYWKSNNSDRGTDRVRDTEIISDSEIDAAIAGAVAAGVKLKTIGNAQDFRARLNDSTCTGCHQTRAIAGFHFPGADRPGTARANSVLLAGSPHFYGDQPRRMEILRLIAMSADGRIPKVALTSGYSARPSGHFAASFDSTQLIGGWGGACQMPDARANSKRQWECKEGLKCAQVFSSENDPGIGTCVPDGRQEIGDAVQRGKVITSAFGYDRYQRTAPKPVTSDTRIPWWALPLPSTAPEGNDYYASHQEFYLGDAPNMAEACVGAKPDPAECRVIRRDRFTGGFPGGMLGLSECIGLPGEATCGLIASSGFNGCIAKIAQNAELYNLDICFKYFTSFAGIRACDAANPCRDDYICVKPMEYTNTTFDERRRRLEKDPIFKDVTGRAYDPDYFGQQKPDDDWIARNDQRGVCIPPYFVFQFRSDKHPAPTSE